MVNYRPILKYDPSLGEFQMVDQRGGGLNHMQRGRLIENYILDVWMDYFFVPRSRIDVLMNKLYNIDRFFYEACGHQNLHGFLDNTRKHFRKCGIVRNKEFVNQRLPDAYYPIKDMWVEIKSASNHNDVFTKYQRQFQSYKQVKGTLIWVISPQSVKGEMPCLYELY